MDGNLIIGAIAVTFGLVTLIGRFAAPDSAIFSKLEPMKEQFGDGVGTALHWVSYTIIPLVAGLFLVVASLSMR
jgi:hypothetical protein